MTASFSPLSGNKDVKSYFSSLFQGENPLQAKMLIQEPSFH